MPPFGGSAEKFGKRYEGRWTVACLLDVMDEKADSIRLEPPAPEDQGFAFWVTKRGALEFHQVRDNITGNCSDFLRALDKHRHLHTRESEYPQGCIVLVSSTLNRYHHSGNWSL